MKIHALLCLSLFGVSTLAQGACLSEKQQARLDKINAKIEEVKKTNFDCTDFWANNLCLGEEDDSAKSYYESKLLACKSEPMMAIGSRSISMPMVAATNQEAKGLCDAMQPAGAW